MEFGILGGPGNNPLWIPRDNYIPRAKSFAFAFKLSKLSEFVDTTNMHALEMIVMAFVTWLLLSRTHLLQSVRIERCKREVK